MTTADARWSANSSAQYETLWQEAPCGLVITDLDGKLLEANRTFLALSGLARSDILGSSFTSLLDTGSQLFYETRDLPVLRLQGSVNEVSLVLRCADGHAMPILVNQELDRARGHIRVAVFDATNRQEYERDLLLARRAAEYSQERVSALQDASSGFGQARNSAELAEALASNTRVAVAATATIVLFVDADGQLVIAGFSHPHDGAMPKLDPKLLEQLRSESVVTVSNLAEAEVLAPELAQTLRASRIEAFSATPLRGGRDGEDAGPMLGMLVCLFGRQRSFDDHYVSLQEALARLAAQALQRIRLQAQLLALASRDSLTGLPNRALVRAEASRAIESSGAHSPVAIIFIDLDGFKAINDKLGHGAGDEVLGQISSRLRASMREGDLIGRFGGDEFVAVCADADAGAAAAIAERMREVVSEPLDGFTDVVTASLGIVVYTPTGGDLPSVDELLRLADEAMYEAKSSGKDRATLKRR